MTDLDKKLIEAHDMVSTLFSCKSDIDFTELSESERETIDYVVERLKPLSVSEVIEASHREKGWEKYFSTHEFIPYDEAFNLVSL